MAGDKAQLRGLNSKPLFDMGVGRSRRLMVPDLVRTESSFKQIDDGRTPGPGSHWISAGVTSFDIAISARLAAASVMMASNGFWRVRLYCYQTEVACLVLLPMMTCCSDQST